MVDQSGALLVSQCPSTAALLGYMGVAAAVCFSNMGSAVRFFASCYIIALLRWLILDQYHSLI